MTKTLQAYLARELARVGLLALVVLTFIMTVFAIVEPLRKQGLSSGQAVALFVYTLPVMLSLTLPVAALFAATIVYGRFSQDNELLACRASGISTLSLLVPALVLGGFVTVASLGLNNYVAPRLAATGERVLRANVRDILYHQLRTQTYVRFGPNSTYMIHADHVVPERNEVRGFIVTDTENPLDMTMMVASTAFIEFLQQEGDTYATAYLVNPTVIRTGERQVIQARSQQLESVRIPSFAEAKVSFFDWNELLRMLRQPSQHPDIRRRLADIERRILGNLFARDVVERIESGGVYERLGGEGVSYVVRAASARLGKDDAAALGPPVGEAGEEVVVEVHRDGRLTQRVIAARGRISAEWSEFAGTLLVTIRLAGPARVEVLGTAEPRSPRRGDWQSPGMAIPQAIRRRAESWSHQDIYDRAEQFISDPGILARIDHVKTDRIQRIHSKIISEIHARLSYGGSCFLLVALGAALGIVYRGGQVLTAFVLTVIPATLVIVMILMGKEMVQNPGVPTVLGLAAIWGGGAALAVGNVWLYVKLMRQ